MEPVQHPPEPLPNRPSSASSPTSPQKTTRIGPLDTFRCLTVTLALVSHCLLEFKVDAVTSPGVWLTIRSLTRASTPGLLLLFGVMAEVVHFKRYRDGGPVALRPRLFRRVAQCYAAFVALAALVMVCRPEPLSYLVRSFGFLTLEGYNVIFALYFFLLLSLLWVLPVRARWGFWGLAALIGLVWAADALVVSRLPQAADALRALGDITLGTGGAWGPSAFHSLTLLLAGMAFGNALYARERSPQSRPVAGLLVVASLLLIGLAMRGTGFVGFFRNVVDLTKYRAHNDVAYYAYGVVGAAVLIAVAYGIEAIAPRAVLARVHALGSKTFSYFVIGNALIILIPEYAVKSAAEAAAEIALLLAVAATITLLWARLARSERIRTLFHRHPTPSRT